MKRKIHGVVVSRLTAEAVRNPEVSVRERSGSRWEAECGEGMPRFGRTLCGNEAGIGSGKC